MRQMRRLNSVTQDLWDVLIITPEEERLEFVRFGAGEDRTVSRKTKIWAHRGASGYAPENTMEAFTLAVQMGADGVELDVQLTKDGQIVVIHDERIDRTTDGTGSVKDYTYEELKKFNAAVNFGNVTEFQPIPTFEEYCAWIAETNIETNIEIKTGCYYYEDIEKKTLDMVHKYGLEKRVLYSSFNQ